MAAGDSTNYIGLAGAITAVGGLLVALGTLATALANAYATFVKARRDARRHRRRYGDEPDYRR